MVLYDAAAQVPNETITFAAGYCVHYSEDFDHGHTGPGAYVGRLTITAEAFERRAGEPCA